MLHILHIPLPNSSSSSSSSSSSPALTSFLQPYAEQKVVTTTLKDAVTAVSGNGNDSYDVIVIEYDGEMMSQLIQPTTSADSSSSQSPQLCAWIDELRRSAPTAFICIITVSSEAVDDGLLRWQCFSAGANMVTSQLLLQTDVKTVFDRIADATAIRNSNDDAPRYRCPQCHLDRLTESALHTHIPLYHCNERFSRKVLCPICRILHRDFAVHIHNRHGRSEAQAHSDDALPNLIWPFALVVCRDKATGRFLAVQEFASSGWWYPGGRVENGETLKAGAIRETKEEAGIDVELDGILSLEYRSYKADDELHQHGTTRLHAIFLAHAIERTPPQMPKTIPDFESVGAAWLSLEDMMRLPLRGTDYAHWCKKVADGCPVYPLALLTEREPKKQ